MLTFINGTREKKKAFVLKRLLEQDEVKHFCFCSLLSASMIKTKHTNSDGNKYHRSFLLY